MALTLIKEDGTGRVDANSYADAADGDAILIVRLEALNCILTGGAGQCAGGGSGPTPVPR